MRTSLIAAIGVTALLGCAPTPEPQSSSRAPTAAPSVANSIAASPPPTSSAPRPRPLDESTIFARLEPGLVACYQQGRKSVPTMLDGRLTLNASIDASGKAPCVIVTDAMGVTQEVQDCMAERFAAEHFDGSAALASVRVALAAGKLALGTKAPEASGLQTVETFRMPDAFEVLDSLLPELEGCIRGVDRAGNVRSIVVGARVATSGTTQCALAMSSPEPLPPNAAQCAENVFRRATFPPPAKGPGLILVPMTLVRR